jgi:hypothetical protein
LSKRFKQTQDSKKRFKQNLNCCFILTYVIQNHVTYPGGLIITTREREREREIERRREREKKKERERGRNRGRERGRSLWA